MPRALATSLLVFLSLAAECDGDGPAPDAGPDDVCIIGDPTAPAQIEFVYRDADGVVKPLTDGQEIPLMLPPQGGKVVYLGIRAKNVTCTVQLNAGFFDDCRDPPIIFAREARPVELREGASGFGEPINDPTDPFVPNLLNIPTCPSFAASRDQDNVPTRFELRVTEALRPGEGDNRRHVFSGTVVPVCGEPEIFDKCHCECDADYIIGVPDEEQCGQIHDNDPEPGTCPG
jgi:hypothetical protein